MPSMRCACSCDTPCRKSRSIQAIGIAGLDIEQQRQQEAGIELVAGSPEVFAGLALDERQEIDENGTTAAEHDVRGCGVLENESLGKRELLHLEGMQRGIAQHERRPLARIAHERQVLVLEHQRRVAADSRDFGQQVGLRGPPGLDDCPAFLGSDECRTLERA